MQFLSLLLDASSPKVQVGLLDEQRWLAFRCRESPALTGLFQAAQECLSEANLRWEQINSFFYCQGPGSQLGLRLAAMAIAAWQWSTFIASAPKVYTYGSLHLKAALLKQSGIQAPFHLLSYFRPGQWNCLSVNEAEDHFNVVKDEAVPELQGKRFFLQFHAAQQDLPAEGEWLDYRIDLLPSLLGDKDLFKAVDKATPFSPSPNEYVPWAGSRHGSKAKSPLLEAPSKD